MIAASRAMTHSVNRTRRRHSSAHSYPFGVRLRDRRRIAAERRAARSRATSRTGRRRAVGRSEFSVRFEVGLAAACSAASRPSARSPRRGRGRSSAAARRTPPRDPSGARYREGDLKRAGHTEAAMDLARRRVVAGTWPKRRLADRRSSRLRLRRAVHARSPARSTGCRTRSSAPRVVRRTRARAGRAAGVRARPHGRRRVEGRPRRAYEDGARRG